MSYPFSSLIDAENYLDVSDPPPYGWKNINANNHSGSLPASSALMEECAQWERRELARVQEMNQRNPSQVPLF